MLETDFVVSAIAEWFVHRMAAAAQREFFFIARDYISLRIDKLNFSFYAEWSVFKNFDYNVRHK